ncbi:hypothetical protein DFS34DRAFT_372029 [Phlyctochytrium arcticum]|nr:hypothetical protein DFS34DRAFT_372029 [Phlyctochytrium arcticum]
MTLRLLRGREERLPSETLQRHVLSSQLSSLELSTTRAIKKASHGPIRTIDLDAAESRFLLSGSADSRIHLYDLDENQPVRRRPEIDQGSSLSLPKTTYVCKPIASVDRSLSQCSLE